MKQSTRWLTVAVIASLPMMVASAPVPVPGKTSQGPISDTLRLLGMLPKSAPLIAGPAHLVNEKTIQLQRHTPQYVTKQIVETVRTADGREMQVVRTVTEAVSTVREEHCTLDACKFYQVSKDGKLEPVEAAKATAALKQKTAVLIGDDADVDPKYLELIKPGTLCIIRKQATATTPPPLP